MNKKTRIDHSEFTLNMNEVNHLLMNEENDFYFKNCNLENFLFKNQNKGIKELDSERERYISYLLSNYGDLVPSELHSEEDFKAASKKPYTQEVNIDLICQKYNNKSNTKKKDKKKDKDLVNSEDSQFD